MSARPRIHPSAYVAPTAIVTGDVTIGEDASVWHHAVLRGDLAPIVVGDRTNVQDGVICHGSAGHGVTLAADVVVGHGALVHGCTVGPSTLIGMGSTILDGACIGANCLIGARSLVTQGAHIAAGTVAYGSPARVARQMTDADTAAIRDNVATYVRLAHEAAAGEPSYGSACQTGSDKGGT